MCPDTDTPSDDPAHVVTAFLRHRSDVLLMRRSDAVGTYRGQWGGVSGFAEGDPDEQVRTEIREETGLEPGETVSFVRSGRPVEFADTDLEREWVVHPYLFDCDTMEIELSEEHDAAEWVSPTELLAGVGEDRETVPELWTAYERVAPTVRSIAADDEHGAASLSVRALEVLRDRAGLLVAEREESSEGSEIPRANGEPVSEATSSPRNDERGTRELDPQPAGERDELAELAGRLLEARPSMAVLRNRINRAMAEARRDGADAEAERAVGAPAVLESALSTIERALAADTEAAATAADRLEGSVATLSRSGTVLEAFEAGEPSRVFVAESRPAREGIDVAERLDETVDGTVTVHTDAAIAHVLGREDIDRVVVGADTVLPDGSVVNKTGTRALALVADREGVPVSVVAATDKVSTRESVNLESGGRSAVYEGDAPIDVLNPTFDVTPADCVTEVVTERGALEPGEIEGVAAELRDLEAWRDGGASTGRETTDRNPSGE